MTTKCRHGVAMNERCAACIDDSIQGAERAHARRELKQAIALGSGRPATVRVPVGLLERALRVLGGA